MSSELDDVARSLFIGQIPNIWRKLAPDTLKSLGNWMLYFLRRFSQYTSWVSERQGPSAGLRCSRDPLRPPPDPASSPHPPPHRPPVAADRGLSRWSRTLPACLCLFLFSFAFLRLWSTLRIARFIPLRVCLGPCPT